MTVDLFGEHWTDGFETMPIDNDLGLISCSRLGLILGSDYRAKKIYMKELCGELNPLENSFFDQWHNRHLQYAKSYYLERANGMKVSGSKELKIDNLPYLIGRVDAVVGSDRLLKIICPYDNMKHLTCISSGLNKGKYAELQGLMYLSGRKFADFVSFDPRQAFGLRFYMETVEYDDQYVKSMLKKLEMFYMGLLEYIYRD